MTGQGQTPQQCVETLKQERKQKMASLHIGDTLTKLDPEKFYAAVIVFYKTDCPFCEKLMPELKRIHTSFKEQGFSIYAVCLDENKNSWKKYIDENRYEVFKNYCDGLSYAGKIPHDYYVFATPTLFIVNENWQIASKPKGVKELEENIKLLCTKKI